MLLINQLQSALENAFKECYPTNAEVLYDKIKK